MEYRIILASLSLLLILNLYVEIMKSGSGTVESYQLTAYSSRS